MEKKECIKAMSFFLSIAGGYNDFVEFSLKKPISVSEGEVVAIRLQHVEAEDCFYIQLVGISDGIFFLDMNRLRKMNEDSILYSVIKSIL